MENREKSKSNVMIPPNINMITATLVYTEKNENFAITADDTVVPIWLSAMQLQNTE